MVGTVAAKSMLYEWICVVLICLMPVAAAAQSAKAQSAQQNASVQITTREGSVLSGRISGGSLKLRTEFGELAIEASRIRVLSDSAVTLDDGSVFKGSTTTGQVTIITTAGELSIPMEKITGIRAVLTTAETSSAKADAGPAAQVPERTPVPEYFGFYSVNNGKLSAVTSEKLAFVSASFSDGVLGVRSVPQTSLDPNTSFVLFDPKAGEIVEVVDLYRLKYIGQPISRASGQTLNVNLWSPDSRVAVRVAPGERPDLIKIVPGQRLEAGNYAFLRGDLVRDVFAAMAAPAEGLSAFVFAVGSAQQPTETSTATPQTTSVPEKTPVTFINRTRMSLQLYLDGKGSYIPINPGAGASIPMSTGAHQIKVVSVRMLGQVVLGTGNGFERTVNITPNATIRITDSDLR